MAATGSATQPNRPGEGVKQDRPWSMGIRRGCYYGLERSSSKGMLPKDRLAGILQSPWWCLRPLAALSGRGLCYKVGRTGAAFSWLGVGRDFDFVFLHDA